MKENDPAWVDRFVYGKWGIPGGQIHRLSNESLLSFDPEFVESHPGSCLITEEILKTIIEKGHLSRAADHGDSAPTACGWFSAYKGNHIQYREYYQPNRLISYHRKQISDLSPKTEHYIRNVIDPQCAKKTTQKYGTRWSVIDEYLDPNLSIENGHPVPRILWTPGDNNEASTRNRISELLRPLEGNFHPVSGFSPSPRLYFIVRSKEYPYGAYHSYRQLRAQKREKVGTLEGKDIYSDDRDPNVEDHAYDYLRYYVAEHASSPFEERVQLPVMSFTNIRKELKLHKYGKSKLFAKEESINARY
jgi:hypothetical protein